MDDTDVVGRARWSDAVAALAVTGGTSAAQVTAAPATAATAPVVTGMVQLDLGERSVVIAALSLALTVIAVLAGAGRAACTGADVRRDWRRRGWGRRRLRLGPVLRGL